MARMLERFLITPHSCRPALVYIPVRQANDSSVPCYNKRNTKRNNYIGNFKNQVDIFEDKREAEICLGAMLVDYAEQLKLKHEQALSKIEEYLRTQWQW